jgi:hypothetical protein
VNIPGGTTAPDGQTGGFTAVAVDEIHEGFKPPASLTFRISVVNLGAMVGQKVGERFDKTRNVIRAGFRNEDDLHGAPPLGRVTVAALRITSGAASSSSSCSSPRCLISQLMCRPDVSDDGMLAWWS